MAEQQDQETCLVLSDEDGRFYAVPTSVLEAHRVDDETQSALAAATSADDVGGYQYQIMPPASGTGVYAAPWGFSPTRTVWKPVVLPTPGLPQK